VVVLTDNNRAKRINTWSLCVLLSTFSSLVLLYVPPPPLSLSLMAAYRTGSTASVPTLAQISVPRLTTTCSSAMATRTVKSLPDLGMVLVPSL